VEHILKVTDRWHARRYRIILSEDFTLRLEQHSQAVSWPCASEGRWCSGISL